MTFPEQILGVPPALVEQGWRREPTEAILSTWAGDHRQHYRWEVQSIKVDGQWVNIYRPIIPLEGGTSLWGPACPVYAHQGWGDGLAPTPDMCNVWNWWWFDDEPKYISVVNGIALFWERTDDERRICVSRYAHNWLGPVLPPVRQS